MFIWMPVNEGKTGAQCVTQTNNLFGASRFTRYSCTIRQSRTQADTLQDPTHRTEMGQARCNSHKISQPGTGYTLV
jgi:hypothetical protein